MYDNTDTYYTYAFVRTDFPIANQIVQGLHAAQEAGHKFSYPSDTSSTLILFQVKNEQALLKAVENAQAHGVNIHTFYEPDFPKGFTAACSEPIQGEKRKAFQKYKLWR